MIHSPPGMPMAVVCQITAVRQSPGPEGEYAHTIFLSDCGRGKPIPMHPTTDLNLVDQAESILLGGGRVVAYGHFLEQSARRSSDTVSQRFELVALRKDLRRTELLGASEQERTEIRAFVNGLLARETPGRISPIEDFLSQELTELNYLVGLSNDHRFERILRLLMLQALSDGQMSPGSNPRLSIAMISDPGQGKGVLSRCAMMMAPVVTEVQPALVTPVGLGVRMEQVQGQGFTCRPGALPSAADGLCIAHDHHRWESRNVCQFQALLMNAVEDGVLKSTKASNLPYGAACAVLLNGNQKHMVEGTPVPKGPRARLADLGLPLDLFSRIDVVLWVGIDKKLEEVARELAAQKLPPPSKDQEEERARRIRRLQLLVAELRDSIPQVSMDAVQDEIRAACDQIVLVLREKQAHLQGAEATLLPPEALMVRMARTLRKLVASSARLYGRDHALPVDVDIALDILGFKTEVIHWLTTNEPRIYGQGSLKWQYKMVEAEAESRRESMMNLFSERQDGVSAEEIAKAVRSNADAVVRDLAYVGASCKDGLYRVPSPYEAEKYREALDIKKEKEAAARAEEAARAQIEADKARVEEGIRNEVQAKGPRPLPHLLLADLDIPLPGMAHKFVDSLPKLPAELRPSLALFGQIDEYTQRRVSEILLEVALMPQSIPMTKYIVAELNAYMSRIEIPIAPSVQILISKRLTQDDWSQRAGFAMALRSALWYYLDDFGLERTLKKRNDLPAEIRRHIESAYQRTEFAFKHPSQRVVY